MKNNIIGFGKKDHKTRVIASMGFRKATADERAALMLEQDLYVHSIMPGVVHTFEGAFDAAQLMRYCEDEDGQAP